MCILYVDQMRDGACHAWASKRLVGNDWQHTRGRRAHLQAMWRVDDMLVLFDSQIVVSIVMASWWWCHKFHMAHLSAPCVAYSTRSLQAGRLSP